MPTPVDPGSIIQVVIAGELYGQQILNVLHYYFEDGAANYRDFTDGVAEEIDEAGGLLELYMACITDDYALTSLDIQEVFPNRLAKVSYYSTLEHVVGILAGPALPSNTAAVLTKQTDRAGRDQIGSFHLAGVPVSHVAGDEWNAGTLSDLGLLAPKLRENLASGFIGPLEPVLWNPANPSVRQLITQVKVQRTIRVMRRRTKGVGR